MMMCTCYLTNYLVTIRIEVIFVCMHYNLVVHFSRFVLTSYIFVSITAMAANSN